MVKWVIDINGSISATAGNESRFHEWKIIKKNGKWYR